MVSFGRNAVLRFYLISTAQARAKFAARKTQFRRRRFTGCSCTLSDMNFILHGRCKEIFSYGGQKREFTGRCKESGIGRVVKIVAGAVYCGCFQNVGRCVSLEGLRLYGRRRESAPWILCFEVEGLNS